MVFSSEWNYKIVPECLQVREGITVGYIGI